MKQIVTALKPLFDRIEARFEKIDARFDKVEAELGDVKGLARRTAAQVTGLVGDMADVRHTLATKMATKEDISRLTARMDAFVPEIEASRRERFMKSDAYMLHQKRLDDHEKRLLRLETRRA